MLRGEPLMALAFLVHETKRKETHAAFLSALKSELPTLRKGRFVVVTDEEFDLSTIASNWTQVYCWNHLQVGMLQN